MNKLENVEGELDWEKFSTGKYVIATRYGTGDSKSIDYFKPGEKVTVSNEDGETREYEVLAVADMPYACGFQHFGIFNCNYILPEKEFLNLMGEGQPMRTIFNVEKKQEEKMEAVGMTGKQLKEMLCFEGGYYALFTSICALILSAVLSVAAVRPIGGDFFFFTWKLTVMPVVFCIPMILVVVLIVPLICYKNMNQVSVVERMRRAE